MRSVVFLIACAVLSFVACQDDKCPLELRECHHDRWAYVLPECGNGESRYEDDRNAASRTFLWTFSMPAQDRTGGMVPPLSGGTYRLEVVLPTETGSQTVTSSAFTVQ